MSNYCIASWGSDSWAGTLARPWLTEDPWNTLVGAGSIQRGDTLWIFGSVTLAAASIQIPTDVDVRGGSMNHRPTVTGASGQPCFKFNDSVDASNIRFVDTTGGSKGVLYGTNVTGSTVIACKIQNWTASGIDGGSGASANTNQIIAVELTGGAGDAFTVGNASGWLLDGVYAHDVTGGAGVDGAAFHDSNAFKNIVRRCTFRNIAATEGKAGVSVGSTGAGGGSWVEVDGCIIDNCGNWGILCAPLSGVDNRLGRLVATNNRVRTSTTTVAGVFGIGVAHTANSYAPIILNNVVYNRYAYTKSGSSDLNRVASYYLDCSATATFQPQFFNNVSILSDSTNQVHFRSSVAYYTGASVHVGAAIDQVVNNNCYYPDASDAFMNAGSPLDFATLQTFFSAESAGMVADPKLVSATPSEPEDFMPLAGSPLIGAGRDVSSTLTVDCFGLTRSSWSIGATKGYLPHATQENIYEAVVSTALKRGII